MQEYLHVLRNYAVFGGRARRREFWLFTLFSFLFSIALRVLDDWLDLGETLSGLYSLVLLLPTLAVSVRRLHDAGKTGWFMLILLVPLVGFVWLLALFCTPGDLGPNRYGADPGGFVLDSEPPYEY